MKFGTASKCQSQSCTVRWLRAPSFATLEDMGTEVTQTTRAIDVTGLSEEAIRAVESLVSVLREVRGSNGGSGQNPPDLVAFERGLDELSDGLPPLRTLPEDFSRADVYGEHS